MIKKFKYKDVELFIKTNMTKKGRCYFGEKDIQGEFEIGYREAHHQSADMKSPEQILMFINNHLKYVGIKIESLNMGNLIYKGTKMTDFKEVTEE